MSRVGGVWKRGVLEEWGFGLDIEGLWWGYTK